MTENSKRSAWVEKEVSIALTQEINGKGPKVIPLLLKGCDIPTVLADKYYVTIDEDGKGIPEVVPAIFRDSYILDISLSSESLECDSSEIREELYEFIRESYVDLKIRINHRDFNHRVATIAKLAAAVPGTPDGVIAQIRRESEAFDIELPVYWVNLSELLARLIVRSLDHYGRNLDGVKETTVVCKRALDFAQFVMCMRIDGAVFPIHAEQFGHLDIGRYLRRFSHIESNERERLVREICEYRQDEQLAYVGMAGNPDDHVVNQTIYVPVSTDTDRLMLRMTCSAEELIPHSWWFRCCSPQILGSFLHWTAFRDGKPLHEIPYNVGFLMGDYRRIGFA